MSKKEPVRDDDENSLFFVAYAFQTEIIIFAKKRAFCNSLRPLDAYLNCIESPMEDSVSSCVQFT